ncbi:MAG: 50S ribosomal protein L24 [Candidatus Algichlamydia australiensis]|nr:50S ribosomal protein L24 [Chlamydiales bacterium]
MSKWIKTDDKVLVRSGNDKGRIGKVLARNKTRIVVQGVNVRKKHMRKRDQKSGGEIIEVERPIHISNVSFCSKSDKPVRIKVKQKENGTKDLYYLEGGKEVVIRTVGK